LLCSYVAGVECQRPFVICDCAFELVVELRRPRRKVSPGKGVCLNDLGPAPAFLGKRCSAGKCQDGDRCGRCLQSCFHSPHNIPFVAFVPRGAWGSTMERSLDEEDGLFAMKLQPGTVLERRLTSLY